MTIPSWTTDSGHLATISENVFYETQLNADGDNVVYKLQAGIMPPSMQITHDGKVQGSPTRITSTTIYTFVVRAYDSENPDDLFDRSFSLTIEPTNAPFFITTDNIIVTEYSGVKVSFQVEYSDSDSTLPLTIKLTSGTLPRGLTMNTTGLISGIMTLLTDYPTVGSDYNYYDHSFELTVNDGTQTVARTFTIRIKEPPVTLPPVIMQDPGTIGTYRYQNYFEYKFIGFDVFNQEIEWSFISTEAVNYDEAPYDSSEYDSTPYDLFPFDIDPVSGTVYGLIPTFTKSLTISLNRSN